MKKEIVYIVYRYDCFHGWFRRLTTGNKKGARAYLKQMQKLWKCRIIKQTTTTRVERKVVK